MASVYISQFLPQLIVYTCKGFKASFGLELFMLFLFVQMFHRDLVEVGIIQRSDEKQQHKKTMKCQGTSQWKFAEQVKSHWKCKAVCPQSKLSPKKITHLERIILCVCVVEQIVVRLALNMWLQQWLSFCPKSTFYFQ